MHLYLCVFVCLCDDCQVWCELLVLVVYGIAKLFCSLLLVAFVEKMAPLFAAKAFSVYGHCDAKALTFCINVAWLGS